MRPTQDLRFSRRARPAQAVRCCGVRNFLLLSVLLPTLLTGCAGISLQLSGLQFDSIVQGNDEHAQNASLAAQKQTCSAAQPFRDASQKAATDSAALAAQSGSLANGIKTAIAQRGALMTYLTDGRRRIDEALAAYQSARAQFESNFIDGAVNGLLNLGNVVADTGAYSQAIIDVGRAYETAAMDLELLVGGMGAQIAKYLPAGVDLAQLATDFRANSKTLLDGALENATTSYNVPANYANIRVDQIPNTAFLDGTKTDFFVFQTTMQRQQGYGAAVGDPNSAAGGNWTAVQAALETATGGGGPSGSIAAAIVSSNDQIAVIADQTQVLSAEAARNAWLAVDACGGALPLDLPPLASPFDNRPELIPSWSSTFWDISSP